MIVLLTDYGYKDPYAGVLKAVILKIHPAARILDLTHGISPQNIVEAACCLKHAYSFFPHGSIFLCVVDPGVGTARKILCAAAHRYFFVGPDNGIFDLVLEQEKPRSVISVENPKYFLKETLSQTFHGRDIMAPVSAYLEKAKNRSVFMNRFGPRTSWTKRLRVPPVRKKDSRTLEGRLIYYDHFGNGVTNIEKSCRKPVFWQKAEVRVGSQKIGPLRTSYSTPKGPLALFNGSDCLEIAEPQGSFQKRFKYPLGTPVTVRSYRA